MLYKHVQNFKIGKHNRKLKAKLKANKPTEYFLAGPTYDSKKERVLNQHNTYIKTLMFLMAFGALKAYFLYSLSQTASCTRHQQDVWHMYCRNHFKMN